MLAGKPVIILAAYISPCRPLIGAELDACQTVRPAGCRSYWLAAWMLNMSNGTLGWPWGGNSCVVMPTKTPVWSLGRTPPTRTTPVTPDVLDIVMTRGLPSVYLASCSALSSDHLPVLIDTVSLILPAPTWKQKFRSYSTVWLSTRVLRTVPCLRPWLTPPVSVAHVMTQGPRFRLAYRMKYAWKLGCGCSGKSLGTPLWKLRSTASRVTNRLNEWRNDQWGATLESRRPIALEDDQAGDESSHSVPLSCSPWGESLSRTLRSRKPSRTVWRLSSSWLPFIWFLLSRWLMWC
jgi:hypothetical protein